LRLGYRKYCSEEMQSAEESVVEDESEEIVGELQQGQEKQRTSELLSSQSEIKSATPDFDWI
jgi:hypothetical protein